MLLHRVADRSGLVVRLREAMRASPWMLDRAHVLVGLVVGIALGARNLRQAELLARHHAVLVGDGASDSTLWRMLGEIDDRARARSPGPGPKSVLACGIYWPNAVPGFRGW